MQRLYIVLTILILVSCTDPKELVKSSNVAARCHCEGKGKYTLVLDAGMGNFSLFYLPLFQKLKLDNRVCLLDRPGYNMDTVTTDPRNLATVATEFDNVLTKHGITDSIILVGHSLGGLHVRMYQSMYPEKVLGLVLLDAASARQFDLLHKEFYDMLQHQSGQLIEVIDLAQKDYLKYAKGKIPTFGLPDNLLDQYYEVATKPEYYYSMKAEVDVFEQNLNKAEELNQLRDLPLLIIASENSMDESILPSRIENYPFKEHNKIWLELQKELCNLSSNSTFVASKANHYLNVTDTNLVYAAISEWLKKQFN